MFGGEKAGAPEAVEEALFAETCFGVHDHVAGEVFVHAAEAVAEPGAEAGAAGNLAAGLDIGDGRVVVDGLSEGAVDDAEFFGDLGGVGEGVR